MKIFISWSGDASHTVAAALKTWLPNVLPKLDNDDVFLSSSDIGNGEQWILKLDEMLEATHFGIVCVTPQNVTSPWLLYESGALSKHFGRARVAPLLIGLDVTSLVGPLSHWNAGGIGKDEVRKLIRTIDKEMGGAGIGPGKLDRIFEGLWKDLEPALLSAKALATSASAEFAHDIFLSAPMASYKDDAAYVSARSKVKKVFDVLKDRCKFRVFWAGEKIEHVAEFDTVAVSVGSDVRALQGSRFFVLLYPEKLASSALFEAGYACAMKLPSHYFVRDRKDLPFLMKELPGAVPNVYIHGPDDWKNYDDLCRKLCKNKAELFPP